MDELKAQLVEYATLLRGYASDFEVRVVDMFDPELDISFDDPDDDTMDAEVHRLIGWVQCASVALEESPVQLLVKFGAAPEAHDEDAKDEDAKDEDEESS